RPSGVETYSPASPGASAFTVATRSPGALASAPEPSVASDHSTSPVARRRSTAPPAKLRALNPCSLPTGMANVSPTGFTPSALMATDADPGAAVAPYPGPSVYVGAKPI